MTHFDPDAGVLRLTHGDLAVLVILAADPASTRLHDHAVAGHVTTLRRVGLLGAGGVHPAAAPLAEAIGSAQRTAHLHATDHGTTRQARLWISGDLAVVGLAAEDDPSVSELFADTPARLPDLVGDFVGLGHAPTPTDTAAVTADPAALAAALAAQAAVTREQVAAAVDRQADDPWVLAAWGGLAGSAARWRLTDDDGTDLEVLDAGRSGLWEILWSSATATVAATTPAAVRTRLAALSGQR